MTPSTATVSPLRQRMLDDMRMRNLAPKTQSAYIRAVRSLTRYLRRSPDTASPEDLRLFQLHMVDGGTVQAGGRPSPRARHTRQRSRPCNRHSLRVQPWRAPRFPPLRLVRHLPSAVARPRFVSPWAGVRQP